MTTTPAVPPAPDAPAPPSAGRPGVGRNVIALGVVSMLTDVSSEMLIPVMPLFVTQTLHASVASLGIIEGVAESTASLLRLGSGWLSDRIGRRKPFLAFGYGLSAVAKTAMAAASSWHSVLALRFADRVGKGLRNPPRDALIADSVSPELRGRAFGLHRGLDTLGAAIGPFVAFAILSAFPADYRRVFLLSAIPAALSLVVLAMFVRAPRRPSTGSRGAPAPRAPMGGAFWRFCVADGVFQLGNSSMAFVLLRAREAGFDSRLIPLVYAGYNLVYAGLSYPVGALSDRIGRRPLLLAAYTLYAGAYALLAWQATSAAVLVAFAALGLQSALLEVSERSLVSDLVPADRRATAFGLHATVVGCALLPASLVAGALWDRFGARVTFAVDAAFALLGALLLLTLLRPGRAGGAAHAATA